MLSYDGKKIIPAPLVALNKTYNKTGDGKKIGLTYQITLTGTLLPFRGSPSGNFSDINNAFWTLGGDPPDQSFVGDNEDFNNLLRKQEAIRFLFSEEGKSLEWQPSFGQPVVKCNPRILEISFEPGTWTDRVNYTITLEADSIFLPTGLLDDEDTFDPALIKSASENWEFEEIAGTEGDGYTLVHTVSAVGVHGFDELGDLLDDKEGWEHAKDFAEARSSGLIDPVVVAAALGGGGWIGGSFFASKSVDEAGGTFTVTENFKLQQSNTFIQKDFAFIETSENETITASYNGIITAIDPGGRLGNSQAILNAKAAVPSNATATLEASGALQEFLGTNTLGEPTQKNIAVSQKDGIVSFIFSWTPGEDVDFIKETEATIQFNAETGEYTFTFSSQIQGRGEDKSIRLTNAKAQVPTDSEALSEMTTLLGTLLPIGIDIDPSPRIKGTSVNEGNGSVRADWTFRGLDSALGGFRIEVSTVFPHGVFVEISIPGRTTGPIQQKMNTLTSRIVTVNLTSENNATKPDNATVIAAMNDAGGIDASWFLQTDEENFNIGTKNYRRRRTHVVKL